MNRVLRKWLVRGGATIGLLAALDAGLMVSGRRVLVHEDLVRPGTSYLVPDYGNLKQNAQPSLVCRYFTGRSFTTDVLWYSVNNQMGRDQCPFIGNEVTIGEQATSGGGGSIADWAGVLAVIVAAAGYFTVEYHRRRDERKLDQDTAYQIVSKVSLLVNDAKATLNSLTPNGFTAEELQAVTKAFEIVGMQQPVIGFSTSMTQDLSDSERNLLLRLREEEFMMDFTECFAVNASIRDGIMEYTERYEKLQSYMPPVVDNGPGRQTREYESYESMAEAYPHFYTSASLIKKLRKMAVQNVRTATSLANRYRPMMEKHFPKLHIHTLEVVEPEPENAEDLAQLHIDPLPPKPTGGCIAITINWN